VVAMKTPHGRTWDLPGCSAGQRRHPPAGGGLGEPEGLAFGDHQRNANCPGLTLGAGLVTVCLLGLLGRSGVVAGQVRCGAGSGRASR
jgi:hypothetical protein